LETPRIESKPGRRGAELGRYAMATSRHELIFVRVLKTFALDRLAVFDWRARERKSGWPFVKIIGL